MEIFRAAERGYGSDDRNCGGGSEKFEGGAEGWASTPATAKMDGRNADFRNRLPTSWAAPQAPLQWVVFMTESKTPFCPGCEQRMSSSKRFRNQEPCAKSLCSIVRSVSTLKR